MQFFDSYVYRGQINKGYLGGLDKVFKVRDCHHRIRRQISRINEGLILILTQSWKFIFFGLQGVNKGHLGGLDKVFKIRNRHHRIRREILRKNEGLILILAQSWKFSFFGL